MKPSPLLFAIVMCLSAIVGGALWTNYRISRYDAPAHHVRHWHFYQGDVDVETAVGYVPPPHACDERSPFLVRLSPAKRYPNGDWDSGVVMDTAPVLCLDRKRSRSDYWSITVPYYEDSAPTPTSNSIEGMRVRLARVESLAARSARTLDTLRIHPRDSVSSYIETDSERVASVWLDTLRADRHRADCALLRVRSAAGGYDTAGVLCRDNVMLEDVCGEKWGAEQLNTKEWNAKMRRKNFVLDSLGGVPMFRGPERDSVIRLANHILGCQ